MDGSADHGGTYADGTLIWTLEVEAGAEVTVSFAVEVDRVEKATIKNKATVVEGKNTYTTNEVSTPTDNEIPNNPQTGGNNDLPLWFAVLFVSGGGLFATSLLGKKKREEVEED